MDSFYNPHFFLISHLSYLHYQKRPDHFRQQLNFLRGKGTAKSVTVSRRLADKANECAEGVAGQLFVGCNQSKSFNTHIILGRNS
jgi:hypothetical protein